MWWMVITMLISLKKKGDKCKSRQKDKNLSHL